MTTVITTMANTFADTAPAATETAADVAVTTAEAVIDTATAATESAAGGLINVDGFLETLPMMAKGMLGIFAVTIVIIGAIYLLGLIKGRDK